MEVSRPRRIGRKRLHAPVPSVDFALDDGAPDAPAQLFDMASDPGETRNLYYQEAETANRMKEALEEFKAAGGSAPAR